jgi:hypothetical protein
MCVYTYFIHIITNVYTYAHKYTDLGLLLQRLAMPITHTYIHTYAELGRLLQRLAMPIAHAYIHT